MEPTTVEVVVEQPDGTLSVPILTLAVHKDGAIPGLLTALARLRPYVKVLAIINDNVVTGLLYERGSVTIQGQPVTHVRRQP